MYPHPFVLDEATLTRIGRTIAKRACDIDPTCADTPRFERIAELARREALARVREFIKELETDPDLIYDIATLVVWELRGLVGRARDVGAGVEDE
jgi:hypothetical protein